MVFCVLFLFAGFCFACLSQSLLFFLVSCVLCCCLLDLVCRLVHDQGEDVQQVQTPASGAAENRVLPGC